MPITTSSKFAGNSSPCSVSQFAGRNACSCVVSLTPRDIPKWHFYTSGQFQEETTDKYGNAVKEYTGMLGVRTKYKWRYRRGWLWEMVMAAGSETLNTEPGKRSESELRDISEERIKMSPRKVSR